MSQMHPPYRPVQFFPDETDKRNEARFPIALHLNVDVVKINNGFILRAGSDWTLCVGAAAIEEATHALLSKIVEKLLETDTHIS